MGICERAAGALTSTVLLLAALTGCAAGHRSGASSLSSDEVRTGRGGWGRLVIECDPPDADLFVDDRYWGQVNRLEHRTLRLAAGMRRVEVRRKGYFASFHRLEIVSGGQTPLSVKLTRQPF